MASNIELNIVLKYCSYKTYYSDICFIITLKNNFLHCGFFDMARYGFSNSNSDACIIKHHKWLCACTAWSEVKEVCHMIRCVEAWTGLAWCDCRAGEGESVESNEGL